SALDQLNASGVPFNPYMELPSWAQAPPAGWKLVPRTPIVLADGVISTVVTTSGTGGGRGGVTASSPHAVATVQMNTAARRAPTRLRLNGGACNSVSPTSSS